MFGASPDYLRKNIVWNYRIADNHALLYWCLDIQDLINRLSAHPWQEDITASQMEEVCFFTIPLPLSRLLAARIVLNKGDPSGTLF